MGEISYFPDYACVGFPKCATSFILEKVFIDAGLITFGNKEINIFTLTNYQADIQLAKSEGKCVGIKSPVMIYEKGSVECLLKSGCKIIVCVRYPVQWLKSFYNFRLYRIENGKRVPPGNSARIPQFNEILNNKERWWGVSIDRGRMSKWIRRNVLQSPHYRRENVHWVVQETFEHDYRETYARLMEFLSIERSTLDLDKLPATYSKKNRYPCFDDDQYDQQLFDIYRGELRKMCKLFEEHMGIDLKSIWEEFYSIKI
ncbi:hypothetical protein N9H39_01925 [Gammaproteobacteria bacterium]|nr:hypothetical protein [Gammaproteobacteria bacterium]